VAFDRQLETALLDHAYDDAIAIVQESIESGLQTDAPRAREALAATLEETVVRAVAGDQAAADAALWLLRLAGTLGIHLDLGRVQELLYDALTSRPSTTLRTLGAAVGLAVDRLGDL
jgi:hypothetical protein